MINIFQPSLGGQEVQAVKEVFESNWLGRGSVVQEFERKFSENLMSDKNSFYAITSCTEGLFLAAKLFDFQPEDEVIVPTISFIAAGSAVIDAGAKLVLCDVDRCSLNATAETISEKITRNTKAIILNHYGGHPCDMDGILDLVKKHKIYVIEDSACAVQSFYKGKACGTMGDMGLWSFDAMKSVVTGDGGMVYLRSNELMKEAKEQCYLGLPERSTSGIDKANEGDDIWWEVQVNCPGRRAIMNNVTAAMGVVQMDRLKQFTSRRKEVYDAYDDAFSSVDWIDIPPKIIEGCENSYYFYWIQIKDRNKLAHYLKENGVYTTFRYWPLSRVDYFSGNNPLDFPNTEYAAENTLNLPIHQNLSDDDVNKIISLIINFKQKKKC
jgi:dTDP-4-amino-4,6-dideoxygalactose transaminase